MTIAAGPDGNGNLANPCIYADGQPQGLLAPLSTPVFLYVGSGANMEKVVVFNPPPKDASGVQLPAPVVNPTTGTVTLYVTRPSGVIVSPTGTVTGIVGAGGFMKPHAGGEPVTNVLLGHPGPQDGSSSYIPAGGSTPISNKFDYSLDQYKSVIPYVYRLR